jgi:hypothetical protein
MSQTKLAQVTTRPFGTWDFDEENGAGAFDLFVCLVGDCNRFREAELGPIRC